MAYVPETPGSDIDFEKPGIPSPAWSDDGSSDNSDMNGVLVLIESITVSSDQYSLSYNMEPSGDPFEFKAIAVVINTKTAASNSDLVVTSYYNKDVVQAGIIKNGLSSDGDRYGFVKMSLEHGVWETVGTVAVNGYTQTIEQLNASSIMYTFNTKEIEYPYIDEIRIAPKVNGNTIPANSYVQIFAVRK